MFCASVLKDFIVRKEHHFHCLFSHNATQLTDPYAAVDREQQGKIKPSPSEP